MIEQKKLAQRLKYQTKKEMKLCNNYRAETLKANVKYRLQANASFITRRQSCKHYVREA